MKEKLSFVTFDEVCTFGLSFRNPAQRDGYVEFCESRISIFSALVVLSIYAVIFFIEIVFYWDKSGISSNSVLKFAVFVYFVLFSMGSKVVSLRAKDLAPSLRKGLESILSVGICFEGALLFVAGSSNTSYSSLISGMPHDLILIVMSPLLLSIVFHSTEWFTTFVSWVTGVTFMCYLHWHEFNCQSVIALSMYIVMSLLISYEYRRQSISKYLLSMNLQLLIHANERMADDMHANEMRHMIANVAHDLKTPLAGFMNGNEILLGILADCEEQVVSNTLTADFVHESVVSMHSCAENMKSINNFMLMTINRCIDYTKASKGLKLIPHHETIDLYETLSLPLNVMKNMQSRIVTVLNQISADICSHIITDKQWLQENILCLLSNAMKYSYGGEVHITLELLSAEQLVASGYVQHHDEALSAAFPSDKSEEAATTPSLSSRGPPQQETSQLDASDCDPPLFLLFEIEDCGIGLTQEAMTNLFNPFKQAQRLTGGTGLGLYSLAKRIDALRGRYGVLNRRDGQQGSRFWFAIPYRPDEASSQDHKLVSEGLANDGKARDSRSTTLSSSGNKGPEGFSTHMSGTVGSDLLSTSHLGHGVRRTNSNTAIQAELQMPGKLTILVVDDSVSILKLTGMMLRRLGHTVTLAENGAEAVDKLAAASAADSSVSGFDVVLMDLQMPIMDGLEAIRRIRQAELNDGDLQDIAASAASVSSALLKSSQSESAVLVSYVNNEFGVPQAGVSFTAALSPVMSPAPHRHQLIVAVSANSDHDTMTESLAAGADAFMHKPFTAKIFTETYLRLVGVTAELGVKLGQHDPVLSDESLTLSNKSVDGSAEMERAGITGELMVRTDPLDPLDSVSWPSRVPSTVGGRDSAMSGSSQGSNSTAASGKQDGVFLPFSPRAAQESAAGAGEEIAFDSAPTTRETNEVSTAQNTPAHIATAVESESLVAPWRVQVVQEEQSLARAFSEREVDTALSYLSAATTKSNFFMSPMARKPVTTAATPNNESERTEDKDKETVLEQGVTASGKKPRSRKYRSKL